VFTTHFGHTPPVPLISGVPQGSGSWASPIYLVHGVYHHCLCLTLSPIPHVTIQRIPETPLLVARLSSCIDHLVKSYASLRLQLNPSKTEFIWFGSRTNLLKIPSSSRSLQVCDSVVDCSEVVRDLGVFFDSETSMKHHVSKTASACFYHIRRLRQICHLDSRGLDATGDIARGQTSGLL